MRSTTNSISRNSVSLIENEIEALNSIYPDHLEKDSMKPKYSIKILLEPNHVGRPRSPICWIKLLIIYNEGYPKIPPEIEIVEKYNISSKELDSLNEGIDDIVFSKSSENSEMIYDICQYIDKFLDEKSKAYNVQSSLKENKLKFSPIADTKRSRKLSIDIVNKNSLAKSHIDQEKMQYIRKCLDDGESSLRNNLSSKFDDIENYNKDELRFTRNNIGNNSRLLTDFEIIEKIGQGGGGSVYKVRHHIDKQLYAIKKIKLNTKKNPEKILKEVMLLSRLQHPNIVRYYQAWYEDYENAVNTENNEDEYEINTLDRDLTDESAHVSARARARATSDVSNNNNRISSQSPENISGDSDDDNSVSDNILIYETSNKNKSNNVSSLIKYLVIQMEYCEGQSLREAIEKKLLGENKIKWKIIIQIIDALSYIHSKQLIHRDIKPANIFLDKNYNVKLGDFGLATVSRPKSAIETLTKLSNKEFLKFSNNKIGGDLLSCGIGTMYYCSPEQEKNNKYDNKTDMFSLGIVIFEMFYNFNSLMERDIVLRNIKENYKFPIKFGEFSADADAVDIVKRLTINDPDLRPSSNELLNSNLVSRNYNEKTVLDNLSKMVQENENFYAKVVQMLFKSKILNSENKDPDIDKDDYLTKIFREGENNQKSFNFIFSIYNNIVDDVKKLLKRENAEFIRFSDIESFDNMIKIYDSNIDEILAVNEYRYHITTNESMKNIMLTETGHINQFSRNSFNQIAHFIHKITEKSSIASLGYLKIYTDSLSHCKSRESLFVESNEINYNYIWPGDSKYIPSKIKIIFDDEIIYEKSCIDLLISSIEYFEFANDIQININSSYILDFIFKKLGIDEKSKFKTIQFLNQQKNSLYSVKNLLKIIDELTKFPIPIEKDKFKELLIQLDNCGDIENMSKKFDKRHEIILKEIQKIQDLFEKVGKTFVSLRNKIKIDFSLMPCNLNFYSGIYFQIVSDQEKFILFDGGRIDNQINSLHSKQPFALHGFSVRFFIENIFLIKFSKLKEKNYSNFKLDILIINTNNDSLILNKEEINKIINSIECIKKKSSELKFTCESLNKKQSTTEFNDFFIVFRMRFLIIIKYDETGKNILIECKNKDKRKTIPKETFLLNFKEIIESL